MCSPLETSRINAPSNDKENPNDKSSCFESLLEKGKELYKASDFDSCFFLIEKFSSFASSSEMAELNFLKAKILMKLESYPEAEAIFKSIYSKSHNKKRIIYKLGLISKRKQKMNDALSYFQEASKHANSSAQLRKINIQLGSCSLLAGNLSLSEEYFKAALSASPCPESHACLAWLHLKKGSFDKAIDQIAACKVSLENNSSFYKKLKYLLALCFTHKKRYADALEVLSTGESFHSLCLSGVIYAIVGQLTDAKGLFDEAVLAEHKRWEAYHNLSITFQKCGNWAGSTEMKKKSIELGGSQDTQDYVIPDLDIADFILEGSTNSPSHLKFKEVKNTSQDRTGIFVECPSGDTDISNLPITPLVGLPLVPVSSDMRITLGFMKNILTFCHRIGKKTLSEAEFGQDICDLNMQCHRDFVPAKRIPSELPLFQSEKKHKNN